MQITDIKGVKKYRCLENRYRVYALQYTGKNKQEVQEFLEMKTLASLDGSYMKCNGQTIEKDDYIVRNMIVTGRGNTPNVSFTVFNKEEFETQYWRKEDDERDNF